MGSNKTNGVVNSRVTGPLRLSALRLCASEGPVDGEYASNGPSHTPKRVLDAGGTPSETMCPGRALGLHLRAC